MTCGAWAPTERKAAKTITQISPPGKAGCEQQGFSLFELLVVLILIAVVAAVAMPSFSGAMKHLELETASRDLITRMKHARSQAIAHQQVFRILFHPDSASPGDYVFGNEFGEEVERFTLPKEISFFVEEQELPPMISFYPNGRSSGGTVVLRNQPGRKLQVVVDPITGFATLVKDSGE